jgi:thiamine pyrophosphate-dependent acetolactate synthase large subunit-like protein
MGRGLIPDTHPLCFNSWRRRALKETDLFVLAGGALDWRFRHGHDLAPGCSVIHAGLNADHLGINHPTAWQACMPPMEFVKKLRDVLNEPLDGLSGWDGLLGQYGKPRGRPFAEAYVNPAGYADPYRFLAGLGERLPEDAIVVIDGSICLSLANHALRASRPFSWFDPGLNGCIGSGIPQAIGARLAAPDRPVVAIIGDTGFAMSAFELETAARYGIAIKVIVFNNSGITGAHRDRKIYGGPGNQRITRFHPDVRHESIAKGLGIDSKSSDDAATAMEMIDVMLAAEGPTCLNLRMDPNFPVPDIW